MDIPEDEEIYLNNNADGSWYNGVNATQLSIYVILCGNNTNELEEYISDYD